MRRRVISDYITPVFSIVELRLHLRVDTIGGDSHPDDSMILRYSKAAQAWAQNHTGMAFGEQTWEAAASSWLELFTSSLPGGPVLTVEAVEYLSADDSTWTAYSAGMYGLDVYSVPSRLQAYPAATQPALLLPENSIRVRYQVGATVPEDAKAAMLLVVGDLYLNRENIVAGVIQTVPNSAKDLLAPHRMELGV